jgi:hypothetical protein
MVKLTATSNLDLEQLAKQFGIKHFAVYSVDELPKKLAKQKSMIVNLDNSDGPGTHWVAVYNGLNQEFALYCDPFGLSPDPRVLKYLKTQEKPVAATTKQLQAEKASSCGYWCIYLLKQLNDGVDPIEMLAPFDSVDQSKNEKLLREHFEAL